jgi:hypothetical protein
MERGAAQSSQCGLPRPYIWALERIGIFRSYILLFFAYAVASGSEPGFVGAPTGFELVDTAVAGLHWRVTY